MQDKRRIFNAQKNNAKRRGIEFKLTFDEWEQLWDRSGCWAFRGRRSAEYCMARCGDVGAYEVGNVRIITNHENQKEHVYTPAIRSKMGKGVWTEERRKAQAHRMRLMVHKRWSNPLEREKLSLRNKRMWSDDSTASIIGAKISERLTQFWGSEQGVDTRKSYSTAAKKQSRYRGRFA